MNALSDPSMATLVILVLISLIGGIGITAIGPGGVLVTIALFLFTDLSPAEVAGTAIVTHVGTGILGSAAYVRSGQLREPQTRRLAVVLCLAALVATPAGVYLNTHMSGSVFGVLLAVLVMLVGVSVFLRERRQPVQKPGMPPLLEGWPLQFLLGSGVALVSGVFGLGGPMVAVPVMVVLGVPILQALGSAQGQSVVLASIGSLAYLAHGAVVWPLVFLTGVPELVGVWLGWKVAHSLPRRPLTYILAATLVALGPVIAIMR